MRHFNSHPCLSSNVSLLRAATGLSSAVDLSVPWVRRFLLPQQSILSRFIHRVSLSAKDGNKKEPEEDLGPARTGVKGSEYHLLGGGSAEVTVSYLEGCCSKRRGQEDQLQWWAALAESIFPSHPPLFSSFLLSFQTYLEFIPRSWSWL